jgi:hypothetical protein
MFLLLSSTIMLDDTTLIFVLLMACLPFYYALHSNHKYHILFPFFSPFAPSEISFFSNFGALEGGSQLMCISLTALTYIYDSNYFRINAQMKQTLTLPY